jgi:hypothetical protein
MISILTSEDDNKLVECTNCDWRGPANTARLDIKDLDERVEPGGEVPVAECPQCRALCFYVTDGDKEDELDFASVGWTIGDVQTLFDVDDEQATEFLLRNERRIQERMTELGWSVLQDWGNFDHLPPAKEDDDDEE